MQMPKAPAWIICFAIALAPRMAAAQQPGSFAAPRQFPGQGAIDSRPGYRGAPSPPQNAQSANVRLLSAEQPVQQKTKPQLRLTPRSEAGRQQAKKTSVP